MLVWPSLKEPRFFFPSNVVFLSKCFHIFHWGKLNVRLGSHSMNYHYEAGHTVRSVSICPWTVAIQLSWKPDFPILSVGLACYEDTRSCCPYKVLQKCTFSELSVPRKCIFAVEHTFTPFSSNFFSRSVLMLGVLKLFLLLLSQISWKIIYLILIRHLTTWASLISKYASLLSLSPSSLSRYL